MNQVTGVFRKTLEVQKSKFIAYLMPYNEFKSVMQKLKEENTKARHFVYAYRFTNDYEQIVENLSDDGEPKNSSGKPCLSVLQGNKIINSAIIVVRYFGGTKLGVGGLIRAYGSSVNDVLAISNFSEYVKLKVQNIEVEYSNLSKVEYNLRKFNLKIITKEFTNLVKLKVEGRAEDFEMFKLL